MQLLLSSFVFHILFLLNLNNNNNNKILFIIGYIGYKNSYHLICKVFLLIPNAAEDTDIILMPNRDHKKIEMYVKDNNKHRNKVNDFNMRNAQSERYVKSLLSPSNGSKYCSL